MLVSNTTLDPCLEEAIANARVGVKYKNSPLLKQVEQMDGRLIALWHEGTFSTTADSMIEHFMKHGSSVGAKDVATYVRKAEGFAQRVKRGAHITNIDGGTPGVRRFRKDGMYIDLAPDKRIISFGIQ